MENDELCIYWGLLLAGEFFKNVGKNAIDNCNLIEFPLFTREFFNVRSLFQ